MAEPSAAADRAGMARFGSWRVSRPARRLSFSVRPRRALAVDWYEAAYEYLLSTPEDGSLASLPAEWQRELVALMLGRVDNRRRGA